MGEKVDTEGRDYTRQVYQNLMAVAEYLEDKSPLPISQKRIRDVLGLSKNVVHDICWNLCKCGWTEDMGEGLLRWKCTVSKKEATLGDMVLRFIRDVYGVEIKE